MKIVLLSLMMISGVAKANAINLQSSYLSVEVPADAQRVRVLSVGLYNRPTRVDYVETDYYDENGREEKRVVRESQEVIRVYVQYGTNSNETYERETVTFNIPTSTGITLESVARARIEKVTVDTIVANPKMSTLPNCTEIDELDDCSVVVEGEFNYVQVQKTFLRLVL